MASSPSGGWARGVESEADVPFAGLLELLRPALEALGAWGASLPRPSGEPTLSAVSVLWFVRGCLRGRPTPPTDTYRVELDDGVWTIRTVSGRTEIESGETAPADAGLRTDPATLGALIDDPAALDAAIAAGTIETTGSARSAHRLLRAAHASSRPASAPPRRASRARRR